jgi:hypothetical protein
MADPLAQTGIIALQRAICTTLGALPGVASCRPYAGELEGHARATLRVPALLVLLARLRILPDPGTGEIAARTGWSVFACTRHADNPEARGEAAWALAAQVLIAARGNRWGVPGVSAALLAAPDRLVEDEAGAVPLWALESHGVAVREVRWTHDVRIGASDWDGAGLAPAEVWLGIAPRIGEMGGTAEDYWRVAAPPGGLAP